MSVPVQQADGLAAEQSISVLKAEEDLRDQIAATNIVSDLETALGKHYASLWFDPKTGEFHINVLGADDRASAERVTGQLGISSYVEFDPVSHDSQELADAEEYFDNKLRGPMERHSVAAWASAKNDDLRILVADKAGPITESQLAAAQASLRPDVSLACRHSDRASSQRPTRRNGECLYISLLRFTISRWREN